jgi:glutaredoxin 3
VILYATSWCPACRAARQYLTEHHIPFVEKDIEKDSAAADELMEKARAQGVSTSGVPVLDVNGTLMQGFDPDRLGQLLGK